MKVSPAFLSLASASKDGIPGINLVFVSNLLEPVLWAISHNVLWVSLGIVIRLRIELISYRDGSHSHCPAMRIGRLCLFTSAQTTAEMLAVPCTASVLPCTVSTPVLPTHSLGPLLKQRKYVLPLRQNCLCWHKNARIFKKTRDKNIQHSVFLTSKISLICTEFLSSSVHYFNCYKLTFAYLHNKEEPLKWLQG